MRNLIKTAVLALALGMTSASVSAAEEVSITSGSEGGTYNGVFGANLSNVMTERGYEVEMSESEGSVENIERVASGEYTIGFTQADALDAYMDSEPTSKVEIMGSLGQECVFVAVNEDGPVKGEDDLGQEGIKIAVGNEGSGSAETWDYLRSLESSYMNAETYREGGLRAMSKVKSGLYDAFLWVTSPGNLNHQFLRAVYQDGSNMELIDVNDWDLNGELPNGQQVYEFQDVVTREGWIDDEIETPCMDVLVVAHSEADDDVLDDLAEILMMDSNRITSTGK